MIVTKKILPKSQVELTIEVSVEEAAPFIEKAAARISKEVNIKGFRPGKVPYDVLKQHIGEAAIYEEAFKDIVDDTYPRAVDQEKLMVVGRANIDVEKVAPGNPFVYKATAPLMPKVELGDYKSLKTKKPEVKMDEKKFDQTLADLRKMRAKEKLVTREAKKGDKVVIDFDIKIDGVSIEGGKAEKQSVMLGEGNFIPGFEDGVEGMKKDEKKEYPVTFPKEYFKKDLAGKKAIAHITLHDVYEMELPELTDEFAKELNFESVEKLKNEIRENIKRELEQEVQEKFELDVIEEVIKKSKIEELPEQLIEDECEKMLRELEQDIVQRGLKFDDYLTHMKKTRDELKDGFKEAATKRIHAAIVLREVAVAEDIKAEAAEIEKELSEMKEKYKNMPDLIMQLDSPAYRARMENIMVHRKTFERLASFTK